MTRSHEALSAIPEAPSIVRATSFRDKYLQAHPDKIEDEGMRVFFKDFTDGRFWGVISQIDGETDRVYNQTASQSIRRPVSEEEMKVSRQKRRHWATDNFTHLEIEQIFDIYLDQALHAPVGKVGGSTPGSMRGHTLVYEQIVDNQHSMFRDRVTPDLKQELNNLRFWEELPDLMAGINRGYSFGVVGDVLENNFDDLAVVFAKQGFGILERNGFRGDQINAHLLSDKAIDKYIEFVGKIDQRKDQIGVSRSQVSMLIAPYIEALFAPHPIDPEEALRFEPYYNYEDSEAEETPRITPEKDTLQRLEDPLIQDYLQEESIKKIMVEKLQSLVEDKNIDLASDVMVRMPNSIELIQDVALKFVTNLQDLQALRRMINDKTRSASVTAR